jgi:D-glycero-D-manno-heptose 1,7-bisphosphate phosphatase
MGKSRYTSVPASEVPQQNYQQPSPQQQQAYQNWPQFFPKPVVGLDRDGTIIEDMGNYITSPDQVRPIDGSLEAVRMLRLKGHRVVILTNQGGIQKGLQTVEQVDAVHQHLMNIFGLAGIFSIDGLFYSTSSLKDDDFAKPNIGMFNRAKNELGVNWKQGWYVGDKLSDLKAADKAGSIPVLVLTGHGKDTLEELNKFTYRELKQKTKVFNNLFEFASTL